MPRGEKTKALWLDPEYRERMVMSNVGRKGVIGRKLSEETKRKIGLKSKGRLHSAETKKKRAATLAENQSLFGPPNNFWRGKKRSILMPLSDEAKQRMREGQLGPRGSNWQGGKTAEGKRLRNSTLFKTWRKAVFARDNWTCQRCLVRGGTLNPHHILNFSEWIEQRFDVDNGMTLCVGCHDLFHNTYGQTGNNRLQLQEFIDNHAQ